MSGILIKVYRENLVENMYQGDIAIVNTRGEITFSLGDSEKITYWRSAAKLVQVLTIIYPRAADKYKLTDKKIAIMASSNNGE